MKQRVKFLIRLALTLAIVGVILWQLGGLGEVSQIILQMDPRYVLLGILMMTLDRALMTYKWVRLLRGRGVHLPFFLGMQIYCAAMIWGMLLPATMGADAIRAFSTSRKGFNANDVVASIIIERMVGFLAVLLLGLFSLVLLSASGTLDERFNFVWLMSAAVLLAGTLAFAVSFSRRAFELIHSRILYRFQENGLFRRLRQFHETYMAYQDDKANLALFFGLTFLEQLVPILFTWLLVIGLGIETNMLFVAGVVPLTLLISRIPVTIDGLGVYDGIFALLMSMGGATAAQAIAITLLGRIIQIIVWLPWWAAYVIGSGSIRPPKAVPKGG